MVVQYYEGRLGMLYRHRKFARNVILCCYTCSGATLIENIIIELGIRLKFEEEQAIGDFFAFQKRIDGKCDAFLKTEHLVPSQFGLPSLVGKEVFNFRNDVVVFFTHNKDYLTASKKTFTLVRDPRDTMLSRFRMHHDKNPELFLEFCQTHLDEWVDFYRRVLEKKHIYIVRFEDLKLTPFLTLRNLMSFINLPYPDDELQRAVERSTFERTKAVEDEMIKQYPDIAKNIFPKRITKSGQCYQHKLEENADLSEGFDYVSEAAGELLHKFGY